MEHKTCIKCGQTKPLTDFHVYNKKISSKCRECHKQYQKEYRKRKPEPKQKRRKRYIKESLDTGMRYRVGLKYILDMPTETHAKCTKCGQWKTLEHYRKDNSQSSSRPNYYRTICVECESNRERKYRKKHYVPAPRRPQKTEREKREEYYIDSILSGDGCCIYCGETTFWKLNNHHPWKKRDPNFTVTLCENHHAFCTRKLMFLLEDWY